MTLVSGIWDLGRDKIDAKPGWDLFKRPFTHYTDKFKVFLNYRFPKIVFLDPLLFDELKPAVSALVSVTLLACAIVLRVITERTASVSVATRAMHPAVFV